MISNLRVSCPVGGTGGGAYTLSYVSSTLITRLTIITTLIWALLLGIIGTVEMTN